MKCYAKAIKDSTGYNSITNARLRLSSPLHKYTKQCCFPSKENAVKEPALYLPCFANKQRRSKMRAALHLRLSSVEL